MFRRTGVAGLSCRLGGAHVARTDRLWLTVARLADLPASFALLDDVARYWQGSADPLTLVLPDPGAPEGRVVDGSAIAGLVAAGCNPLLWHAERMDLIARHRGGGALVVQITVYLGSDGGYQIGGTVERSFRGQGYGQEALAMVCRIAHQHLGIATLTAGCEWANEASRRWLSSCGFSPVDGPPRHVLPNGRTIAACWWRHSAPAAFRCRNRPAADPLPSVPPHIAGPATASRD